MDKEQILTKIQDCGIVAVVRAESTDKAIRITDACIEGGVAAIELTFTVPHADKVIEELAKRYTPDEIILGAGTVLDATTPKPPQRRHLPQSQAALQNLRPLLSRRPATLRYMQLQVLR